MKVFCYWQSVFVTKTIDKIAGSQSICSIQFQPDGMVHSSYNLETFKLPPMVWDAIGRGAGMGLQ